MKRRFTRLRLPRRVRFWAHRLWGWFPLTPAGLVLVLAALAALRWYGRERDDLIVLTAVGVALAALGFSLLTGLAAAFLLGRSLRRRTGGVPLALTAGIEARTGFKLPRLAWLPWIQIGWSWRAEGGRPPPVQVRAEVRGRHLVEVARPLRRHHASRVQRAVDVRDLFGAVRITLHHEEARAVRFLPSPGGLRQIDLVTGAVGGDGLPHPDGPPRGDPYDMRRYVPGDPVRMVLWKVFARTRKLVVRTPERALSPSERTIAYLVAGPGDEAAAGSARSAIESGSLGPEWIFGADGVEAPVRQASAAHAAIVDSVTTSERDSGAGLGRFLQAAQGGPDQRLVVFAPPRRGPWVERLRAVAGGVRVQVLICLDGLEASAREPAAARWLLRPDQGDTSVAVSGAQLRALWNDLAGLDVLLVDRKSGAVWPRARVEYLLAQGGQSGVA